MSNLFYQGADVLMSSGADGANYAPIARIQSVNMGYSIPRTNVLILGRFKALDQRPVINYTPANASFEYVKGDKDIERNLGILNSTGVGVAIGNSTTINGFGARNVRVLLAPVNSSNYAGEYFLATGVLNSFSLGGSVGDPVKGGFTMEFLDRQQVANNSARTVTNYNANVIRSQDITLTGINFTGLGYSGLIIQSFKLDINYNRTATIRYGEKYPERRVTDVTATLALQGFFEGSTNTVASLSNYDCGNYITGNYSLSLLPSCSSEPATVINMTNPYLESENLGVQVGNYISVDLNFSVPISIRPEETTSGSNLTIT